jgi:hypothetical protein
MLLALFLIKTDSGFCAIPTLDWSGEEGLWNDGVHPDYGIKTGPGADTFTFQVSYQDASNHQPLSGYPKVHIKRIISNELNDIPGSPFTLTEVDPIDGNYEDGKLYSYSTTLSPAGNDYKYSFVAYDSLDASEEFPAYGSPANDHTLTVVTGYVWVDDDFTGTSDGSEANPYKTIATGISNAISGQAVRVKAGTYSESFTMASGVHVVSDNSGGGDAQEDYENSAYHDYYGYYPQTLTRANSVQLTGTITFGTLAEDVTLDGISVYNLPGSYTLDISGGSPVIKNSIVRRSTGSGRSCIEVASGAPGYTEPVIENNLLHSAGMRGIGVSTYTSPLIQDNEIWGTGGPGIGINCKGTPGGEITILNNLIFNNDEAGIGSSGLVSSTTNQMKIVIQGNTIHHNGLDPLALRAGIGLKRCCTPGPSLEIIIGGSDPSRGNTIYNNGMAGIRLDGSNLGFNPVLIQNNTISDNDKAGIRLIDVGFYYDPPGPDPPEDPVFAEILDNTIYGQTQAGINIGGTTYADIADNTIFNNYSGIAFQNGSQPSSGTVNIKENKIFINTHAGITVRDAITGVVTIAGNDILYNVRAGIGIINSCNLVINRNEIHDNYRGGIRTGGFVDDDYFANSNTECTDYYDPYDCCTGPGTGTCNSTVGFIGNTDSAFLDVSQNKVYGNGTSGYGAGMNIRHASGTVYNNLVYENPRAGIKYGNYIDEIINNTVVGNGDDWFVGSGIVYDSLDGYVTDEPSGDGPAIPIRNNISALNTMTGIKTGTMACLSGDYRDYNLLYGNNGTSDELPPYSIRYKNMQLCGCEPNDNEKFGDPQFVDPDGVDNIAGNGDDDYRIQVTSPAVDSGDDTYGTDVSVPPGVGTTAIDMGAYGGPYGIDW